MSAKHRLSIHSDEDHDHGKWLMTLLDNGDSPDLDELVFLDVADDSDGKSRRVEVCSLGLEDVEIIVEFLEGVISREKERRRLEEDVD